MRLLVFLLFARFAIVRSQECYDDGNEFCIDENDILSADLLPGSFLLMDQYYQQANLSRSADDDSVDGSREMAFDEMEYHRKKMNEYLCHEYIAEEIIRMEKYPFIRVKRKNDMHSANSLTDFLDTSNVTAHDKLIADEGSKNYKQWLHRPTTMEDVYRHIESSKKLHKKQDVYEPDPDGEIEGELMVMKTPVSQGKMGRQPPMDPYLQSSSGHFPSYDWPMPQHSGFNHHVEHIHLHQPPDEEEHYEHEPVYYSKGKGHDLTIKDFFEIALTALAFLAFGLFIIQLLMNITAPIMTTTTAATVLTDFDQRFKRHALYTPPLSYANNEELNELAQRVLRSIEAVLVAQADNGNCLRRLLCEDNRFSRDTEGGRRIWIPVWSLGMSWVSSRVLTRRPWSAMLDSVKASVLGLGKADCAVLYPDCELGRERIKRRRRRRKR